MANTKCVYGDLYGMMVRRHERNRREALRHIRAIERLRKAGFCTPELVDHLSALRKSIPSSPPPRRWIHAVGLSITVEVKNGYSAGTYTLKVVGAQNPDGFELNLTGPARSIVWSPSTGMCETNAFLAIGGWRWTLTRFFGLETKVSGYTKVNRRRSRRRVSTIVIVQTV